MTPLYPFILLEQVTIVNTLELRLWLLGFIFTMIEKRN